MAKGSFSVAERNAIAKELEKLRRGDDDNNASKWRYIYNLVNPKDSLEKKRRDAMYEQLLRLRGHSDSNRRGGTACG